MIYGAAMKFVAAFLLPYATHGSASESVSLSA